MKIVWHSYHFYTDIKFIQYLYTLFCVVGFFPHISKDVLIGIVLRN
jgi:hypothetical protein